MAAEPASSTGQNLNQTIGVLCGPVHHGPTDGVLVARPDGGALAGGIDGDHHVADFLPVSTYR
jgi:hypothetical protein